MDSNNNLESYLNRPISRRDFLKLLGLTFLTLALSACSENKPDTNLLAKAEQMGKADHPIILLHGNFIFGNQKPPWLDQVNNFVTSATKNDPSYPVWSELMPDNFIGAHANWEPYTSKMISEKSLVIGHSTGATEILYAASQGQQIDTAVIVAGYTDQYVNLFAAPLEAMGGRFTEPFDSKAIHKNIKRIIVVIPKQDEIISKEYVTKLKALLDNDDAAPGQVTIIEVDGTHEIDASPDVLKTIEDQIQNFIASAKTPRH